MYWFVIPLILGFSSNVASTFTMVYSEKWGKARGTILTFILRNITGIPVWAAGFVLAISESAGLQHSVSLLAGITGWLLITAGGMIIIIALFSLKTKAAAPSTGDTLIKTGIYSIVCHPIHSGTFLEFIGLFILWPSFPTGVASVLGFIWIFIQTKFEEQDLIKRIPEYREYSNQIPRFIPFCK